jgi:tetratricopeptide (TPR) repeat protein
MELRDHVGAEKLLTEWIDSGRPTASAYLARAKVRLQQGDAAGAAADREKGMELQPTDAESWLERGLARIAGEPEHALHDFEAALASTSNSPRSRRNTASLRALRNMAHVYAERLQRPDDALQVLEAALALDPNDVIALAGRGVLLARKGELAAASRDAQRLEELPIDPITQYQVACIYSLCSARDTEYQPLALQALSACLRRDASILDLLPDDPDLQAIRALDQYEPIVAAARILHGRNEGAAVGYRDEESRQP